MIERRDADLEIELRDVFHVRQIARDTPTEKAVGADLVTMEPVRRHAFIGMIWRKQFSISPRS